MSLRIDPTVFLEDSVSEETREFNARVAELVATAPRTHERPPEETRAARAAVALPKLDQAVERTISGPGGEIPLRVFTPDRVEGVHLCLHGGGWVLGRADAQDERLWDIEPPRV